MILQMPTQFKTDDDRHGRLSFLTRGVLQDILGQSCSPLQAESGKRGGYKFAMGCVAI